LKVSVIVKIAMECFEIFGGQIPSWLRAWSRPQPYFILS